MPICLASSFRVFETRVSLICARPAMSYSPSVVLPQRRAIDGPSSFTVSTPLQRPRFLGYTVWHLPCFPPAEHASTGVLKIKTNTEGDPT
jgi:hypothetical protein